MLYSRLNKRGIFFTYDGIIASLIIITTVILAISIYNYNPPAYSANHISGDFVYVLAELKVFEANNSYVTSLINDGYINKMNNSILEQIGELWAERSIPQAQNLSIEFAKFLPDEYGFGVYVDGETLVEDNSIPVSTLSSAQKMISGIQRNRSSDGFIAKAYATKARKNNTLIVKGDVITSAVRKSPSGNNGNKVNVSYDFFIPTNASILNAYWFIEAAWTDTKFKAYMNGDYIPGSDASGSKLLTDLESYVKLGNNTANVEYRYGSGGDEGGDDGATHIVVNYSTSQLNTIDTGDKYYFQMVNSNSSIRYKKPVFVVGTINSIDINLNVIAPKVNLSYTLNGVTYKISNKSVVSNNVQWSDAEILSVLSSNGHGYSNLSNKYFWFEVDVDGYKPRDDFGNQRAILADSYVHVDSDSVLDMFGYIDITSIVGVSSYSDSQAGDFYRNVAWQFNVRNRTIPVNLDSQLAWLYYTGTDPSQNAYSNAVLLYAHPPNPLVKEFARFGYTKDFMINGTNTYSLSFGSGYGVNPFDSLVSTTFLVPVSVGYGDTFVTLNSATDDAQSRLNNILGEFVSATDVSTDVITLSKVPSMWGPAVVEVRVWR